MFVVLEFDLFIFLCFSDLLPYDMCILSQQTEPLMVDFDFINPIIKYNKARLTSIDDHPRVTHNLLGYTPIERDSIKERPSQPDWLGPDKRPKRLEDKQRVKVQPAPRAVIPTGVVIGRRAAEAEAAPPTSQVTLNGQFNFNPEAPSTSLAKANAKNRGVYIGLSPCNN